MPSIHRQADMTSLLSYCAAATFAVEVSTIAAVATLKCHNRQYTEMHGFRSVLPLIRNTYSQ